jgi:hypothetical protein
LSGGTITGNYLVANASSPYTYYLQFGDNTGWIYRYMTSVSGTPTERFRFSDGGIFQAVASVRAPIFYDSDNTAYYVDPNDTSSARFAGYIGLGGNSSTDRMSGTSGVSIYHPNYPSVGFSTAAGPDYLLYRQSNTGPLTVWNSSYYETVYFYPSYTRFTGSAQAPIFYDSDNTAYYVDPASTSNIYNLTIKGVIGDGVPPLQILPVSSSGAFQWASTAISSSLGSGQTMLQILGNALSSGNSGYLGFNYTGAGSGSNYVSLGFYANDNILRVYNNVYTLSLGSMRSPLFYDNDNTGYYVDPASYSFIYYLSTNVGQEAPGAANSSSVGMVLRGNYNSNTWAHKFHKYDNGSGVPLYLSTTYGGGVWTATQGWGGGLPYTSQVYGSFNATDSIYSPIFYDSDNTGYYVNPNGTSNIYALTVNQAISGSVTGYSNYLAWQGRIPAETGRSAYYPGAYTFSTFTTSSGGNPPTTYAEVLAWGGGSAGAIQIAGDWISTTNTPLFVRSLRDCCQDWSSWTAIATSGVSFTNNVDLRAPIFYDSNNTAYYVDPASGSYLYGLTLSGGAYFRPNNWIELGGDYGIYSSVYNSAHFLANIASTYGQWRLIGSRGGFAGIYDTYSAVNGIMYDSSGNGGVYREANGRWYWYYNVSTNCMGIGTSNTNSAYNIYCPTGVYSGGRVDGTIFYDSNDTGYFCDPSSTSILNIIGFNGTSGNAFGNYWAGTSGYPAYQFIGGNSRFGFSSTSGYVDVYTDGNYYGGIDLYGANRLVPLFDANQGGGALYSSIVYDSNDTAYYVDPTAFTNLYGGIQNSGAHTSSWIQNRLLASNNGASTGEVQLRMWCSEPGVTWDWAGFGYNVMNDGGTPGGFGRVNTSFGQAYMRMSTGGDWYFYNTTSGGTRSTTMQLSSGGAVIAFNNVQAPIFYDYNNTAYYGDFASTSVMNNVQITTLGVGTAASGTTGEIRATNNVTAYYSSDIKFKENVREIPNALEIVEGIGGKLFDWKDEYIEEHGGEDGYFIQKNDFGVIAQDVLEHFPVAVRTRPDGSLAVDYEKLSALAFAAVVSLSNRVKSLEALR